MFKPENGSLYISIAFAAGSIGILFLRFVFDNTHWPASFFAVLCMVGYAVFAKKNQTVDSYDNIGDNCYYLGFLFTLISLAIGLYSFDPNEFQSILKITNNFALAIISTLIGLFLRVLFNQIKNESLDESGELEKVIEKTSTDISTEGKKVSRQLSNLSNSINEIAIDWKNSSVAIKQKFEEMVDDFSSNTSKTLNEHTNSVNTHFEEMQNKFSTTFTSMLEKTESTNRTAWSQIETTINSIKSNSDSLLNVIKSMETGITNINEKLMSIKPIDTAAVDELSSSLSSLKSVFENIGNFAEEYRSSIGSATETISSLNNETLQLTTTLSNQKTNIPDLIADQIAKLNVTDDLANEIQKLTTVANNFNENLNVGSFKSIESTLEQINNRLMRFSDELVGITNETRDNIEKLETGLIQITTSVVKSINER